MTQYRLSSVPDAVKDRVPSRSTPLTFVREFSESEVRLACAVLDAMGYGLMVGLYEDNLPIWEFDRNGTLCSYPASWVEEISE